MLLVRYLGLGRDSGAGRCPDDLGPDHAPTPTPAATASSEPAPAATGSTDLAACRDARCEIVVRGKVEIPLDPKFGFSSFTVTFVPPDRTLFAATGTDGGSLRGGIGGAGRLTANGISIEVVSTTGSSVVLRFTPPS